MLTVGAGATVQATNTTMATMGIGNGLIHVNGGTLRAGTMTTMGSAARVQYDAGTFQAGALQLTGNARIALAAGRDKAVETTEVSMDLPGGSAIDLADNFMIVDYAGASPIATIKSLITSAYNGGSWNGNGLGSSLANASTHGVGHIESSDAFSSFPAMFGGRTVDDTSVLIAYARYGDANLDGTVNLQDFNRLAANFGQTNTDWSRGDFTFDGITNLQDFNRLAANFGLSAGPGGVVDPQDWAALASVVPEPGAMLALSLTGLLGLRRRKSPHVR
jgi:hypothetical protein